ncbi:phosphoglycerate kinase-like protein [Leptospira interrogans serovar Bataviae str. HAI135]|nr:phosphoglycerate kinase-like protein [Leptospira interrogans serovar Bataviae str. HAI135]
MELPRLENVDLSGKRVFLRVDFNVPIENGKVTDKTRIEKTLPTIELLIKKGARIVIASHLGRPKGQVNPEFSLAPVVETFKGLVKANVYFSKTVIGEDAVKLSKELKDGEILVIENVRFHKEEEENDPGFSKKLSALADIYVNDAFGAAHRAHSSTEGIAHISFICRSSNAQGDRGTFHTSAQTGQTVRGDHWRFQSLYQDQSSYQSF